MSLQGSRESPLQYDFVPQHIPGRINVIADSLSRVTLLEFQDSNAEKDILAVNFLQYSSVKERERDEVLQETSKDKELQSLKHYISTGWPMKRSQIPVFLHPYWNYRDDRSQMNCASISDTAETPDSSSDRVVGSNNHSLSIADLPLTQDKVESIYADVFQGLGKFPGDPYKLRLKPDAVQAKHRPRRVPVHLQDAFHEEVE